MGERHNAGLTPFVLSAQELRVFCEKYNIPQGLNPTLLVPVQTVVAPDGMITLYTKSFEFVNRRYPLTSFLLELLLFYGVRFDQISPIGLYHSFYVSFAFLVVTRPRRDINTPIEDPSHVEGTYEDGLCTMLASRSSSIVVFDEPVLVLAGVSQNWDTPLLRLVPVRNGVEVDLLDIVMGGDLGVTWKTIDVVPGAVSSPVQASSAHSVSAAQGITISPLESEDENEEVLLVHWGKRKIEESSSGSSPKRPNIRVIINPLSPSPAIVKPLTATAPPSTVLPLRSFPVQPDLPVGSPVDRITDLSPPPRGASPPPSVPGGEGTSLHPFDDHFPYELGHGDEIPILPEEDQAAPFFPNWSFATCVVFDSAEVSHDLLEHVLLYGERVFNRSLTTAQLSWDNSFYMANQLYRSIEMHHRMLYFESRYHALLSRHNDFGVYLEKVMTEKRALLKEVEEKGKQLQRVELELKGSNVELQKMDYVIQGSKVQEAEIVRLREEISGLSQQVLDKEAECVKTSSEMNLFLVDLDHVRGEVRSLEEGERGLKAQLARLDEDKQHLETLLTYKENAWSLERNALVAERDGLKADLAAVSAQKETLVLENHRLSFERAVNKAAKAVGFLEGFGGGLASLTEASLDVLKAVFTSAATPSSSAAPP
ncbi:hypothetical protein L1987_12309 [Smallanthus sonchifolius]|uniref:Uncharacterized protein n=1 Tax=Smallanthus sonchifolius TaxID=185202 RepID=A0ACB9JFI1_9ASTR|nr:hypothetical protein L1987_12309 [Smallanthus sonchifolius]